MAKIITFRNVKTPYHNQIENSFGLISNYKVAINCQNKYNSI